MIGGSQMNELNYSKSLELAEEKLLKVTGGAEQGTCPRGYCTTNELKCKDCPYKTVVEVTPNCFVKCSCDYGLGEFWLPKETNIRYD